MFNIKYFFILFLTVLFSCGTTKDRKVTVSDLEIQLAELQSANAYSNSRLEDLGTLLRTIEEDAESNRIAISELKENLSEKSKSDVAKVDPKNKKDAKNKNSKKIVRAYPGSDFRKGFNLFTKKKYDSALKVFKNFEKKHPGNRLVPDALYWSGEIYYDRKLYKQALDQYKRIPEEFPVAGKIEAAILKMGFCYLNLNLKDKARARFKEVIEIYPDSNSALIAKKKIGEIK